ncbi:MAG: divalent-cation tolerance protein CutA [Gammaproteobacteria bacterium]|nr:divalent-cation tolerance protein CutA [Gammaproteobacteria bacterium]
MAENAVKVVFCTCPDATVAEKISVALVESSLAACVNRLEGVTSTYRWEGKLCQDVEYLLMIKTTTAAMSGLENCIRDLHPYELPEVIAVSCSSGSAAYIDWVKSVTRSGKAKAK